MRVCVVKVSVCMSLYEHPSYGIESSLTDNDFKVSPFLGAYCSQIVSSDDLFD